MMTYVVKIEKYKIQLTRVHIYISALKLLLAIMFEIGQETEKRLSTRFKKLRNLCNANKTKIAKT